MIFTPFLITMEVFMEDITLLTDITHSKVDGTTSMIALYRAPMPQMWSHLELIFCFIEKENERQSSI